MTERLGKLYEAERHRLATLSDVQGDITHPVFGDGSVSSSVMFIGEAPGAKEAEKGRPFVGKAGEQLQRMLDLSGIDRGSLYVTNAVKFRPWRAKTAGSKISYSNRTPTASEIADGAILLRTEIEIIAPKVIVTLGNTPLSAIERITGESIGRVGDAHGRAFTSRALGRYIYPLYHPASGIYNRALVEVMEEDLIKLGRFISEL